MTKSEILALASRFFDAAEKADLQGVADCYSEDFVIWHNIDEREKGREEGLALLAGSFERLTNRQYARRRLNAFEGGFVQQYVLSGTRKDGVRISMPAAVIGRCRDGKITRLDEYLDTPRVLEARKAV